MNFEMCGFKYSNKYPLIKRAHIMCFYRLMDSFGFDGTSQSTPETHANDILKSRTLDQFHTTNFQ